MPRYFNKNDEYCLRKSEELRKSLTKKVYLTFIRKTHNQIIDKHKLDYETTGGDKLFQIAKRFDKQCPKYEISTQKKIDFIALPPEKLMKILIKPKYITLGKVSNKNYINTSSELLL